MRFAALGDEVVLFNIKSRPEINLTTAKVVSLFPECQRVGIKLSSGEQIKIKLANVRLLLDFEEDGIAPEPAPAPEPEPEPAPEPEPKPEPEPEPEPDAKSARAAQATEVLTEMLRRNSVEANEFYACPICGAHRAQGYRCCGQYLGLNGEAPVAARDIHSHPDADEDEVDNFLQATLARLNKESS